MTPAERHAIRDLVYHRFIQFQPGMMLIRASEPERRGYYKASAQSTGDNDPPVAFLNSLDNINEVKFLPDLSHGPTVDLIVEKALPGFQFELYHCPVWNEKGWRLFNPEYDHNGKVMKVALTGPHETKASALVWSLGLAPPF
jgi:hypothetical protein